MVVVGSWVPCLGCRCVMVWVGFSLRRVFGRDCDLRCSEVRIRILRSPGSNLVLIRRGVGLGRPRVVGVWGCVLRPVSPCVCVLVHLRIVVHSCWFGVWGEPSCVDAVCMCVGIGCVFLHRPCAVLSRLRRFRLSSWPRMSLPSLRRVTLAGRSGFGSSTIRGIRRPRTSWIW